MTNFLDIVNSRREFDKFGMKIHLNLPRTDLVDFRITYGNLYCHTNRDGIGVATDGISSYSQEMVRQLEDAGYYVSEIDMIWTDDCYDIFLHESDKNKEYPKMKVYVHPNEMSGWTPKKEIDKLLEMSTTEIAANLNAREILPPTEYKYHAGDKRAININKRKCYWEAGAVGLLLRNEKYVGDMVLLKTEVNRVTGKQIKRAKEDWVTVENTHEAIISREVFETVAKSFKRINRNFGKSVNIFYCSGCGRKMNQCRGAILKCRINAVMEENKCVETTISVKKAERAILEDIKLKYQIFIDMKAEMENAVRGSIKSLDDKIASIIKTLEYIESAWKNIYSDYADRKISKDEYLLQSKEHKEKKQSLSEELGKLQSEKKQKETEVSVDMVGLLLQKFSDAEELTDDIKSVMIEKVLVYGNNALEIYWKPDFAKYFEHTELVVRKEKAVNE